MLQPPLSNRENQITKLSRSACTGTGLSHYTNKTASLGIPPHSLGCSEQSQPDKYSHREATHQLVNVTSFWKIACLSAHGDSPAAPGKLFINTKPFFFCCHCLHQDRQRGMTLDPNKKKFNQIFSNRASHLLFKIQKLQGGNSFTGSWLNTPALVSPTLTGIHLPKPLIQGFTFAAVSVMIQIFILSKY